MSRKSKKPQPAAPKNIIGVPVLPFWHEEIEPVLPSAPGLSPAASYSFLQYFKQERPSFKEKGHLYMNLERLQGAVQTAWQRTASDHGLDPTLADAWFDWPKIIETKRQETLASEQEEWERFTACCGNVGPSPVDYYSF